MRKNTKAEVGRVRKEKKTTEGKLEKKLNQKKQEARALKSKKNCEKLCFSNFS
jgi:hypothetical protein